MTHRVYTFVARGKLEGYCLVEVTLRLRLRNRWKNLLYVFRMGSHYEALISFIFFSTKR